MPRSHQRPTVPFSLTCSECDAGTDVANYEQAIAEGWVWIDYAPDLPMANFIGLCPDCREQFEHWPNADHTN
jgi:hypothetical protein